MSSQKFNATYGLSVGEGTLVDILDSTGNLTVPNATVTSNAIIGSGATGIKISSIDSQAAIFSTQYTANATNYILKTDGNTTTLNSYAGPLQFAIGNSVVGSFANATSGLIINGNVSFGNFTTTGTANIGTLAVTGTSNLGPVGNVTITGGSSGQFLQTNGSGVLSWANVGGGTNVTDDTSTNATFYPTFANVTTGSLSNAFVSSTKMTFNPSTGEFGATTLNSLSDKNSKTNIKQIENAGNTVTLMTGVSFDWIDGTGSSYGFIAQDLEPILPHAVSTNSEGKKSINYAAVVPFLVETIKQQHQQINDLLLRVERLEDDGR